MKLSYGQDSFVSKWVLDRIPSLQGYPFGPCAAIAVVSEDGRMMAGVVFHDWQPVPRTMQISAAAVTARWATRGIVRQLLAYPFMTCGVQKVWTAIEHGNIRAIRFNEGIGIRAEARLQRHFGESDAVICRMFREEYDLLFNRRVPTIADLALPSRFSGQAPFRAQADGGVSRQRVGGGIQ